MNEERLAILLRILNVAALHVGGELRVTREQFQAAGGSCVLKMEPETGEIVLRHFDNADDASAWAGAQCVEVTEVAPEPEPA